MVVAAAESDGATRKPEREITVQDLLLHTSGLSHRTSPLYRNAKVRSRSITLPQFVANITHTPLMEDPGHALSIQRGDDGAGTPGGGVVEACRSTSSSRIEC